jgi:hypothetical protein
LAARFGLVGIFADPEHTKNMIPPRHASQSREPIDSEPDQLEAATDQAIAACGGDARQAVTALIVANEFLETQVRELRAAVSNGYARGKFEAVPPDRKDWYD